LVSVELPVAANVERENPPTMLHLGSMMKSVVHKQVIEQVGRAMDRSGVLIDPNAETATVAAPQAQNTFLRHKHRREDLAFPVGARMVQW
jgi:hypothetical protein